MSTAPDIKDGPVPDSSASGSAERAEKSSHDGSPSIPAERRLWMFRLRPDDDDEPQNWWMLSTVIPLVAATIGPLANVLSIAALVTSWRTTLPDGGAGSDTDGIPLPDPRWCIGLNAASLVCGFVGNFFLLMNFTRRVRYIIALPMTIILWYLATGILIAITVAMNTHVPPNRPSETYSQGFWHAIIAAVLYLFSSMILMGNMLGYFLGHYPQHFTLTHSQRTLILQTMMFFLWLAGGGAVFSRVCGWAFVDALYFCDVTILTVGFGDFSAPNDAGKGLVFPFSVGGIVSLGLVVGSINTFTKEISHDKVIRKHVDKKRARTVGRAVSRSLDLPPGTSDSKESPARMRDPSQSNASTSGTDRQGHTLRLATTSNRHKIMQRMRDSRLNQAVTRNSKLLLLREEKDRFDAMRHIQHSTNKLKRWYSLGISVTAFGLLWCIGAVMFWVAESREQGFSYFQSLYFCYVSLLTIGYGDLSPQSNAGKPIFIVWSLIAVPTITILISNMSNTVIAGFTNGTSAVADWTILPKAGVYRIFLDKTGLLPWMEKRAKAQAAEEHATRESSTDEEPYEAPLTVEELAAREPTDEELARRLALAIRRTAHDLSVERHKLYSYEEWAEFTRLIRFTSESREEAEQEEELTGLIEWDWLGEDSPMMARSTEAEWILDRLCLSLSRYTYQRAPP
ncbi:MAG: Potassium channel [Caeruleum heppii]|nr:MAG: Potassium channel [Caeruleum heppii]